MADKMERFTQRARRALSLAHEEAERLHHNYIGTEHLLIGLVRETAGIASRVLRDLGVTTPQVSEMVERMTSVGRNPSSRIELAPGTEQVLQMGTEEARRMGHHYIGTEHLLLGMVRQGDGVGMDVLRRLGITPEQIQEQIRITLQGPPASDTGLTSRSQRRAYHIRLSSALDAALDDQFNQFSGGLAKVIQNLEHIQRTLIIKEGSESESLPEGVLTSLEKALSDLHELRKSSDQEDDSETSGG